MYLTTTRHPRVEKNPLVAYNLLDVSFSLLYCYICNKYLMFCNAFLVSRLSGRQSSPDSMTNSYHGNTASEQGISNFFFCFVTSSSLKVILVHNK